MSEAATVDEAPAPAPASVGGWGLVRRQVIGILRLELRKNLWTGRAFAVYFLAFAPVGLTAIWAVTPLPQRLFQGPAEVSAMFAGFYSVYVRVPIFLAALFLFMNLFRSEILERSLHYYLLAPVRRDVLVAAKYLSALVAASLTFAASTGLLFLLTLSPWGWGDASRYLFQGPGLGHLFTYVGISILACAGYGAVFLLAGLFFRNPIVPAAAIWAWEFINFLLPALLKKVSVIHYLRSLYPIPVSEGLFAVVAEPTPAWISVPGLLLFTAAVLTAASWRARRIEITYGGD